MRAILALLIGVAVISAAAAQEKAPRPPTPQELRKKLKDALGERFELVRDQLAEDRSGRKYFLAHLKARRDGDFVLSYEVKYAPAAKVVKKSIERGEFTFQISIAKVGTSRIVNLGHYGRSMMPIACVGDTLIYPVRIGPLDTEHRFTLKDADTEHRFTLKDADAKPERDDWLAKHAALDNRFEVRNKADKTLKLLGSSLCSSFTRDLGTDIHSYTGGFELLQPAKCNLSFRIAEKDEKGKAPEKIFSPGTDVAVNIVKQDEPITVMLDYWRTRGWQATSSVDSPESFQRSQYPLRVGDRLVVHLGEHRTDAKQKAIFHPPVEVTQKDFAPDKEPLKLLDFK